MDFDELDKFDYDVADECACCNKIGLDVKERYRRLSPTVLKFFNVLCDKCWEDILERKTNER